MCPAKIKIQTLLSKKKPEKIQILFLASCIYTQNGDFAAGSVVIHIYFLFYLWCIKCLHYFGLIFVLDPMIR